MTEPIGQSTMQTASVRRWLWLFFVVAIALALVTLVSAYLPRSINFGATSEPIATRRMLGQLIHQGLWLFVLAGSSQIASRLEAVGGRVWRRARGLMVGLWMIWVVILSVATFTGSPSSAWERLARLGDPLELLGQFALGLVMLQLLVFIWAIWRSTSEVEITGLQFFLALASVGAVITPALAVARYLDLLRWGTHFTWRRQVDFLPYLCLSIALLILCVDQDRRVARARSAFD